MASYRHRRACWSRPAGSPTRRLVVLGPIVIVLALAGGGSAHAATPVAGPAAQRPAHPASGTLTGVTGLASDGEGSCAVVRACEVDCWGRGDAGQFGDGTFYGDDDFGSAVRVHVAGVGGTGTLTGVSSLTNSTEGYCALLRNGGVDCWGDGRGGLLGNGKSYYSGDHHGSAVPVQVMGVDGTGTLTGVSSLASDGDGFCALLDSGGVTCWGTGSNGELGNGKLYRSSVDYGSALPVRVKGVGGSGTLTGVGRVVGRSYGYCALLSNGGVNCWGPASTARLATASSTAANTRVRRCPSGSRGSAAAEP